MISPVASSVRSSALRASFATFRAFHCTPSAGKTVTEKVSEVADQVNKKVGKGLASAIDKGEQVTQSTKEKMGAAVGKAKSEAGNVNQKAEQASKAVGEETKRASNIASQKVNQVAAGAREMKDDIQKDMSK